MFCIQGFLHVSGSWLSALESFFICFPLVLLLAHCGSLRLWSQASAICDMNIYQRQLPRNISICYMYPPGHCTPRLKVRFFPIANLRDSPQRIRIKGSVKINQSINRPSPDLARFPKTWGNAVPICTAGVIGIYIGKTPKPIFYHIRPNDQVPDRPAQRYNRQSACSASLQCFQWIACLVTSIRAALHPTHTTSRRQQNLGVRPFTKRNCDRLPQRTHRPRQRQRQSCVCRCV